MSASDSILSELRFGNESFLRCDFNQPIAELNKRHHSMADVIEKLRNKTNRNFRALSRIEAIQEMFDPNRTPDLISFIALGGIDVIVEILCDDVLFSSVSTAPEARLARVVLTDYIRILDEAMIVNGSIAWYLVANHPKLIYRVLSLMELDRVCERCFSLMEHVISYVGPMWSVSNSPRMRYIIQDPSEPIGHNHSQRTATTTSAAAASATPKRKPLPDATFCRAARVLSITVVPVVVAGPAAQSEAFVPYPQSLDKLRRAYEIATTNCNLLSTPYFLKRVVGLLKYSRDTRRRPGSAGHPSGLLPQPQVMNVPGMGQQVQTFQLTGEDLQRIMQQAGGATSMGEIFRAMLSLNSSHMSVNAVNANGSSVPLAQLAALSRMLQGGFGGSADNEDDDDDDAEEGADDAEDEDNPFFDAAEMGDGNGGDMTTEDNALLFARFLNDLAGENAGDEEHGTIDDTAECAWFVGEPDPERYWRLCNLEIDESSAPTKWTESSREILRVIQNLAPTESETALAQPESSSSSTSETSLEARNLQERKTIVFSQSEVLYLINSLMISSYAARTWFILDDLKIGEKLFALVNWFVNEQPALQANSAEAKAPLPSLPTIEYDFDAPRISAQRAQKYLFDREQRRRHGAVRDEMRERSSLWQQFTKQLALVELIDEASEPSTPFVAVSAAAAVETRFKEDTNSKTQNEDQRPPILSSVFRGDALTKEEEEINDAASIASSQEPDQSGHQHNVDTLCRIELVRVAHEFWDARSCDYAFHLHKSHVRQLAEGSTTETLGQKIFDLLVRYIARGADDPCVDNLTSFAIEAYVRGHTVAEREPAQRLLATRAIFPVLDRLLLRSKRGVALLRQNDIPVTGPLPPMDGATVGHRRVDSSFTLIADACRYRPENWAVVEHWLNVRDAGPFVRDRLLRCTTQMALFVRAFLCTRFQDVCCPVALATVPSDWIDMPDRAAVCAASEKYSVPNYVTTKSVYFVRKLLLECDLTLLGPAELILLLETAPPSILPEDGRKVFWFSDANAVCAPRVNAEGQRKINEYLEKQNESAKKSGSDDQLWRAKLLQLYCPELYRLMDSMLVPILARLLTCALVEDLETCDKLNCTCVMILLGGILHEQGLAALERILQRAFAHHKLRRKKAIARIKRRLGDRHHHHRNHDGRESQQQRSNQLESELAERALYEDETNYIAYDADFAAAHACDSDIDDSECDEDFGGEHEASQKSSARYRACLECGASRVVRNRVLRIPCAARAFFDTLCVWIEHYAVHPQFFHSIYFTTQIDAPFFRSTLNAVLPILCKEIRAARKTNNNERL